LPATAHRVDDLFLSEVRATFACSIHKAHQLHGLELERLPTIDNSRGDVGREPGKTQQCIRCRLPTLALALARPARNGADRTIKAWYRLSIAWA